MKVTQDELVRRVSAALAEMGWGHVVEVRPSPLGGVSWEPVRALPAAVAWQAGYVAAHGTGIDMPCFACYEASRCVSSGRPAITCALGMCAHPEGPARPPRELLVAP